LGGGAYTLGMTRKKQIVRQWLETEAAFGVSEVPVAKKVRGKGAVKMAAATPRAAAAPARAGGGAAIPVRPVAAQRAAPVVVPPVREDMTRFSLAQHPADSAGRPLKAAVGAAGGVIPLPPAGEIGDLPVLSRAEKERALAALLEETTAALSAYIDEVATNVVFGEGDVEAPVMFVGEGPGIEEDRLGRPFVGKSGQLLDKQIAAMGLTRETVYIANVVKLRAASPSEEWGGRLKDRPPTPEEVARNIGYLYKQIEIIRPKAIVTLGAPALKYVTASKEGITKIRGTWLSFRGVPVMPTFHPAYVLRNYTDETRRKVWDDLKAVLAKLKQK
jgi:uracil-DNA glycosylase